MPRPRRIELAGGHYHLYNRFVGGAPFFRKDADVLLFSKIISEEAVRKNIRILSLCCMSNHFHTVVRTKKENLSTFLQTYGTRFAREQNRILGRVGHLFQGRHKTRLITDENHLSTVVAYTFLNPVRAKLVKRVEDYKWTSLSEQVDWRGFRAIMSIDELLMEYPLFGRSRKGLVKWLNGIDVDENKSAMSAGQGQFLMDTASRERVLSVIDRRAGSGRQDFERRRRVTDLAAPNLKPENIDRWLEKNRDRINVPLGEWKNRSKALSHLRWWCYRHLGGLTYAEIRERVGIRRHTVIASAVRRIMTNRIKRSWVEKVSRSIGASTQSASNANA